MKIPKLNTLYKCGLILFMLKTFLSSSSYFQASDYIDDLLSIISAFMLFLSVAMKKASFRTHCIYGIVSLIALYSSYCIGNWMMLSVVMVCLASHRQNVEEIIELLLTYEVIFLISHVFLAFFSSLFGHNNFTYISHEPKYNFGFGHPNVFSCYLTNILLMWAWVKYENIDKRFIAMQLAITIVNYLITGTRTAVIVILAFYMFVFISKRKKISFSNVIKFVIPFVSLTIYILLILYSRETFVARIIDSLLSSRIKLGAYWLSHEGVTFFGQDLSNRIAAWDEIWKIAGHVTFDNLYSYLMINAGSVWLILLAICFFHAGRVGNSKCNIFLLVWSMYGIAEIHGVNPIMLFPVILSVVNIRGIKGKKQAVI